MRARLEHANRREVVRPHGRIASRDAPANGYTQSLLDGKPDHVAHRTEAVSLKRMSLIHILRFARYSSASCATMSFAEIDRVRGNTIPIPSPISVQPVT